MMSYCTAQPEASGAGAAARRSTRGLEMKGAVTPRLRFMCDGTPEGVVKEGGVARHRSSRAAGGRLCTNASTRGGGEGGGSAHGSGREGDTDAEATDGPLSTGSDGEGGRGGGTGTTAGTGTDGGAAGGGVARVGARGGRATRAGTTPVTIDATAAESC